METITYLVANYNNEKYVDECINSILNQSSDNWKCIICDDSSTDNSVQLLRRYKDPRIKLIINRNNLGYINTLIKLIENAETDIVGIVDSDDALYTDATEIVMSVYNQDKSAGFVYSRMHKYDEDLSKLLSDSGSKINKGKTSLESGFVSHLKTFRRKYYYKTTGYNERFLYCEDRDLVFKMEEFTKPVFIDKPLYKYRFIDTSASNDLNNRSKMLSNHFKAVIEALNRRNIKGFERFYYIMHFYFVSISRNTNYPRILRKISKYFLSIITLVDNLFNIRSGGELLR